LELNPLIFRDGENLSVMGTTAGEKSIRWREAELHRFASLDSRSGIF